AYLRPPRPPPAAAAFSTRARAGAPVSMPLAWDELSPRVTADRFTVATVPSRLAARRGDPWGGYPKGRTRPPQGPPPASPLRPCPRGWPRGAGIRGVAT